MICRVPAPDFPMMYLWYSKGMFISMVIGTRERRAAAASSHLSFLPVIRMMLLLLLSAGATLAESPFCCGCCCLFLSGILICTLKSAQILCSLAPLGPMTDL